MFPNSNFSLRISFRLWVIKGFHIYQIFCYSQPHCPKSFLWRRAGGRWRVRCAPGWRRRQSCTWTSSAPTSRLCCSNQWRPRSNLKRRMTVVPLGSTPLFGGRVALGMKHENWKLPCNHLQHQRLSELSVGKLRWSTELSDLRKRKQVWAVNNETKHKIAVTSCVRTWSRSCSSTSSGQWGTIYHSYVSGLVTMVSRIPLPFAYRLAQQ